MEVPSWSTDTQAVDRIVQMVTGACGKVYGEERMDDILKSQQVSRELMSRNRSKKDIAKLTHLRLPGMKKIFSHTLNIFVLSLYLIFPCCE